jgi:hypothetical protein
MKALGKTLGIAVALVVLAGPVAADDRAFPHIHYSGRSFQADGTTPFTQAVSLSPAGMSLANLAPPNCYDAAKSSSSVAFSTGQYSHLIAMLDTPACVAAMQTFTPPASAFPDVTAPGWVFRKQ